ncbi:MAG: hypothetical protein WA214_20225, partial [Pseudolabrys sp.]
LRPPLSYHVYTECLIQKHVNHLLRLYFSSQDGTVATLYNTGVPVARTIAAHACRQVARAGSCRISS